MTTKEVAVIEPKPVALKLTKVALEAIEHNIQMAERLVINVLERDVDYGRTPGTSSDGLWDPGAAKIMAAFNAYSTHEVLYHQEDDNIISWTIQASIFNRDSQQVVATGVGAASTKEPKYKYRWVPDPQNYGYSPEEIKTLKTKDGKSRIPNPEYGELVNTLLQMAAKRAEVDGAKSLPGVGSALKKLFAGKARKEPDWAGFWGQITQMGISEERVHKLLGVTSVNQWIAQGKTLDQAIKVISERLSQEGGLGGTAEIITESKIEGSTSIDLVWLNESLNQLYWQENTFKSWLRGKFKVDTTGSILDTLRRLTTEQKQEVVKEIEHRLEML